MNTNVEKLSLIPTAEAQTNNFSDSFDMERWLRAVRPQLLAALQKRAAHPQQSSNK
jgi:hypothetical protein